MKQIISALLLNSIILISHAQNSTTSIPNNKTVYVKSWMKVALMLPKEIWSDNKTQEIIDQIGDEEFQKVKKFIGSGNIPGQFYWPHVKFELKKDTVFYQQRNSKLKVYKIASYKHYWDNKFWGNYAILRVPYSENTDWDTTVKWDTVYFIIPEQFIEEIK